MSGHAGDLSHLHEVRARFPDPDRMNEAVQTLMQAGFDRAALTLPLPGHSLDEKTSARIGKPATTEDDARQARTLGTSTAAAAAALAAAGVIVATGGAAAPAVAGAVAAGAAAGGATYAAADAGVQAEQESREEEADRGHLMLTVRTLTPEDAARARAILSAAGGSDIDTVSE
ncbi:hypothetical protein [Rhodopila sp.]|jgi:hypothetical protein|uniref:hypothetical protein n=1 Tax=Rhodopila sp. TaxID=2480087 RepID=UPI002C0579CA|nr:hypothetical protein [Rhodopila sp.]HVZ09860.1 hypothetical protein [Rhodopila sp.]